MERFLSDDAIIFLRIDFNVFFVIYRKIYIEDNLILIVIKMTKYLTWQCKCGVVYALEPEVPVTLHEKQPNRKKCQNKVSSDKKCGTPFPNQEERDKLSKINF